MKFLVLSALASVVFAGDACASKDACTAWECELQGDVCGCNSAENSQRLLQSCQGGVLMNTWHGTDNTCSSKTTTASWPAKINCSPNPSGGGYSASTCLHVEDGYGPAWVTFSDSACTLNTSEVYSTSSASCSCSTGDDKIPGSQCHTDACVGTSPLCATQAQCENSFDEAGSAMCTYSNGACACKTGFVQKDAICKDGQVGRGYYEGSQCSGELFMFNSWGERDCQVLTWNPTGVDDTATHYKDYVCTGIADGALAVREYYSDASCSTSVVKTNASWTPPCECSDEVPYKEPAGCEAAGKNIDGCLDDGGASNTTCSAGCVANLTIYAQLSCEHSDIGAAILYSCEEDIRKQAKLSYVRSGSTCNSIQAAIDVDLTAKGTAVGSANTTVVAGDGCKHFSWGSSLVACTSDTTGTWTSFIGTHTCTAANATSVQYHALQNGCNQNAYSSSAHDAYFIAQLPWCKGTGATPTEPVVLAAVTAVSTFSAPLSETQQTAVKDAYCGTVSSSTGIALAKLVCSIEAVASSRRRLLAATNYTMSAWASPVDAAAATAVVKADFEAAITTSVTAAESTMTAVAATPSATVTKPASATDLVPAPTTALDFSQAPTLVASTSMCFLVLALALTLV